MKEIKLSQGYVALVDDEEFDRLRLFHWSITKMKCNHIYAQRKYFKIDGIPQPSLMHRLILNVPKDKQIDHKDGNGLNNQKENLRIASRSQNQANSKSESGKSKFKGVCPFGKNRWRAYIVKDWKQNHIGCFNSESEAAKAYDKKAIELYGEYAKTNFNMKGEYYDRPQNDF